MEAVGEKKILFYLLQATLHSFSKPQMNILRQFFFIINCLIKFKNQEVDAFISLAKRGRENESPSSDLSV